jgi:hypothetical protein
MIRPTPRSLIFSECPNLGSEISRIQKEQYDVDELDFLETEAEKLQYTNSFDALHIPETQLPYYYKVISFHHANLGSFTTELALRLQTLLDLCGIAPSIVITHTKMGIWHRENVGKVTGRALKRFHERFPPPDFESAYYIDREDFPLLVDLLFRLSRSEPSAPEYIFFADRDDKFAFFICRYGNVHTVEFGNEVLNADRLSAANWFEIKTRCYEKFE